MVWDHLAEVEIERPTLRVRLVGAALGATILLLGGGLAPGAYGFTILLLYLAGAVALRFLLPASPSRWLPLLGIALDFVAVSALVVALPLALPVWALYIIAIGTAVLRYGPHGAVAATALAPIGYDLLLAREAGLAPPPTSGRSRSSSPPG